MTDLTTPTGAHIHDREVDHVLVIDLIPGIDLDLIHVDTVDLVRVDTVVRSHIDRTRGRQLCPKATATIR